MFLAACRRSSSSISPSPERADAAHHDLDPAAERLLSLGPFGSCARITRGADTGTVMCWGRGGFEFGSPSPLPDLHPERVGPVVDLALGARHACAVGEKGALVCWGLNDFGQVGRPATTVAWLFPLEVAGLPSIRDVVVGGESTCALDLDDALHCFGDNRGGQLGLGMLGGRHERPAIVPLPHVRAVALAPHHACAISDAQIYCWGSNLGGRLGDGTSIDRPSPVPIAVEPAIAIASVADQNCVLHVDGGVSCWGPSVPPHRVAGIDHVTQLGLGSRHACALLQDGRVLCWGDNSHGELGVGTTASAPWLGEVHGLGKVVELAVGGGHTCARVEDRAAYCWGTNGAHEVSPDPRADVPTPTRITW